MAAARCTASLLPCTPAVSAFVAGGRGSVGKSSGVEIFRPQKGGHSNTGGSARRRATTMLFSGLKKALGGQASLCLPDLHDTTASSNLISVQSCAGIFSPPFVCSGVSIPDLPCHPCAGVWRGGYASCAGCALCRHGAVLGGAAGKPEMATAWRALQPFRTLAARTAGRLPSSCHEQPHSAQLYIMLSVQAMVEAKQRELDAVPPPLETVCPTDHPAALCCCCC